MARDDTVRIPTGILEAQVSLMGEVTEDMACSLVEQLAKVEDGDEPVPVNADRESLTSLVDNLLSNAIRYTPEGGTVTATCGHSGEWAWLQVSDTGIGIPEDELAQVFGKFYRGDRARRMISGGLGMGLYIVQHVASNHGGKIEVTSELGNGSTFRFTLPLLDLEIEE